MVSILTKFRNKLLLVISKLLKTGLREVGRFVRQIKVTALNTGLWNWKLNLVAYKSRGLICAVQTLNKPLDFMFCLPWISIFSFKEKPNWCKIYPQYISSDTSTCFGRIYSPSSGGTPYGYSNWYLLIFLDGCLLSCLDCSNNKYQLLYTYSCTSWLWA